MQTTQQNEIRRIPIAQLIPHPKNANVMASATVGKLRRHIEKTGRYEPLVVRPHPARAGCFELINGHHRKQILESLGHAEAACIVWDLDDAETLLLLATINRLGGEDAPGKRLDLLESLRERMNATSADLAKWLPETQDVLAKLLANSEIPAIANPPKLPDMPEAFTVFLASGDKRRLKDALGRTDKNAAVAIMKWVEMCDNMHGRES